MKFQKGQSGNPAGKKPGTLSACAKVKADYLKIFEKLGGRKGFLKWLKENPEYIADFYIKVIPANFPKKTEISGDLSGNLTVELVKFSEIKKET